MRSRPRSPWTLAFALVAIAVADLGASVSTAAPRIQKITASADGYTIVGTGFGTSRSQAAVYEDDRRLPAGAIVSLSPSKIQVRSSVRSPVNVAVVLVRDRSNVVRFERSGAAIAGGARAAIAGLQASPAPRSAAAPAARSAPAPAPATPGIVDRGRSPNLSGPIEAALPPVAAPPRTSAPAGGTGSGLTPLRRDGGPQITAVRQTSGGYRIEGSGFGSSRSATRVYENGRAVPASRLSAVSDRYVQVASSSSAPMRIAVSVSGARTAEVAYRPTSRSVASDMRTRRTGPATTSGAEEEVAAAPRSAIRSGARGAENEEANETPPEAYFKDGQFMPDGHRLPEGASIPLIDADMEEHLEAGRLTLEEAKQVSRSIEDTPVTAAWREAVQERVEADATADEVVASGHLDPDFAKGLRDTDPVEYRRVVDEAKTIKDAEIYLVDRGKLSRQDLDRARGNPQEIEKLRERVEFERGLDSFVDSGLITPGQRMLTEGNTDAARGLADLAAQHSLLGGEADEALKAAQDRYAQNPTPEQLDRSRASVIVSAMDLPPVAAALKPGEIMALVEEEALQGGERKRTDDPAFWDRAVAKGVDAAKADLLRDRIDMPDDAFPDATLEELQEGIEQAERDGRDVSDRDFWKEVEKEERGGLFSGDTNIFQSDVSIFSDGPNRRGAMPEREAPAAGRGGSGKPIPGMGWSDGRTGGEPGGSPDGWSLTPGGTGRGHPGGAGDRAGGLQASLPGGAPSSPTGSPMPGGSGSSAGGGQGQSQPADGGPRSGGAGGMVPSIPGGPQSSPESGGGGGGSGKGSGSAPETAMTEDGGKAAAPDSSTTDGQVEYTVESHSESTSSDGSKTVSVTWTMRGTGNQDGTYTTVYNDDGTYDVYDSEGAFVARGTGKPPKKDIVGKTTTTVTEDGNEAVYESDDSGDSGSSDDDGDGSTETAEADDGSAEADDGSAEADDGGGDDSTETAEGDANDADVEFTPDPDSGGGYQFKDPAVAGFFDMVRSIESGSKAPGAGTIDCGPDGCGHEASSGGGPVAGQGRGAIENPDREGLARRAGEFETRPDYNDPNQGAIDYGPDHVGAGPAPSESGPAPENETSGERLRQNETGRTGPY